MTVNDMDFQQRDPDRPGEAGIRIRTFIEGRDWTFLGRTVESSAAPDELGAGSNFQNGRVFPRGGPDTPHSVIRPADQAPRLLVVPVSVR
ncbi:hypothetical protein [Nakamurella multipartita]|uniref:hypothetical protein n=1 Tax=Nakamurella multipartita TaxID=53461 RepID=UPI0010FE78C0|nr:hypothetical protein [Nakamurella multipartita]